MLIAAFVGRVVIAAILILGILAIAKFLNDASKKGSSNVR